MPVREKAKALIRRAEFKPVPVEKLLYDDTNPRLAGEGLRRTPDSVQKFLEGPPHYALHLEGSIVENGFIPYEPLVVRKQGDNFVVIEGNRRLAAVKHILSNATKYTPHLIQHLQTIPVLIFHEKLDQSHIEEIQTYLGVKHLFGFREWPPLSKAIFLDRRIKSKRDIEVLCRELNITRPVIRRYLIPYRLRKREKEIFRNVNLEDFWALAESFGRTSIRAYIALKADSATLTIKKINKRKLRYLAEFLYGKGKNKEGRRITDTRQIKYLARVLANAEATKELEKGAPLDEAYLLVEPREVTVEGLLRQLQRLLKKFARITLEETDIRRLASLVAQFERRLGKRYKNAKSDI